MDEHTSDRVEEIFMAALDVPGEGRSAFVDDACGDDEALRAEVERLLKGAPYCWDQQRRVLGFATG